MGELGSGSGSSYPAILDTDTTQEDSTMYASANVPNDLADAVIAVEATLGVNPQGNKSDVVTFLQTEHDADAQHTFNYPVVLFQDNVAASQSAVILAIAGASPGRITMPQNGSIVGISIYSNEDRTAGSCTVDATINGTVTGLQAILDGTNTKSHYNTQAKGLDTFSAGDGIGAKITTTADWTPTTADIVVCVFVSFN